MFSGLWSLNNFRVFYPSVSCNLVWLQNCDKLQNFHSIDINSILINDRRCKWAMWVINEAIAFDIGSHSYPAILATRCWSFWMRIGRNKTHKKDTGKWGNCVAVFMCPSPCRIAIWAIVLPSGAKGVCVMRFIRRNGGGGGGASWLFMATRGVSVININHTKAV